MMQDMKEMIPMRRGLGLLEGWARFAERDWYALPDGSGLGCYGSGYGAWGVQTNQKYVSVMAVLGHFAKDDRAAGRALAALRYSLRTHLSGDRNATDGARWGHTWISPLGIERMMHGVTLLEGRFEAEDHQRLAAMLTSEADWQAFSHQRGSMKGVQGDVWGTSGKNNPESNIWVGALLWRVAAMYPEHPHAGQWREAAHRFLMNGVSIEADAADQTVVAGRAVREWHVGANFFPHFALDHHGYFNVGYMVICVSNAAMLHFDLRQRGLERPESLDHHQKDLWQTLRRFIFADGRLARIGGDTRLRYTYCQEYLLPSLLYAADQLGDAGALGLVEPQVRLMEQEARYSGDGGFFSRRLGHLARQNPYYFTRLESDRACVLGMMLTYGRMLQPAARDAAARSTPAHRESSVEGLWIEPTYGAVCHRSPRRLASFAWRAKGLAQGLCQPPDDGHWAEWQYNLAGYVRFLDDQSAEPSRRLGRHAVHGLEDGFLASGTIMEGAEIRLNEGWRGADSALHHLAVAALPDGVTMLGVQFCRVGAHRRYLAEVKGLCLNLPNDLYNGFHRQIRSGSQTLDLHRPIERKEDLTLAANWANLDGRVGVVGIYGSSALTVHRAAAREGGPYGSLWREQIGWPYAGATRAVEPGEVVLDAGWAVLSGVDADATRRAAGDPRAKRLPLVKGLRGMTFAAQDGRVYGLILNTEDHPLAMELDEGTILLAGDGTDSPRILPAGGACLVQWPQ
jgi:hypothetical protein